MGELLSLVGNLTLPSSVQECSLMIARRVGEEAAQEPHQLIQMVVGEGRLTLETQERLQRSPSESLERRLDLDRNVLPQQTLEPR